MSDRQLRKTRLSPRRILVTLISCTFLGAMIWLAGPSSALKNLGAFSPDILIAFFILLSINLFVVSFRFWRVLTHVGIAVPWSVALRASMAGHLSSLFFIPLIGQVAGRQLILSKAGVSPVVNASVAACERTLLAIMSGMLATWGAVFLLGRDTVNAFISELSLEQVAVVASLGFLLSLALGRRGGAFVRDNLNMENLTRVLEIAGITLAGQALMLSCFMLGFHTVAPTVDFLSLFAAAAVVSFAASLPISAGGWGVRELASVFVLKLFGVPAANAIAVSIMIGLFSLLVLFTAVPILTRKSPTPASNPASRGETVISNAKVEDIFTWVFGTIVAILLFFQVQVPLADSTVALNLADPFAMLFLAALALQTMQARSLPSWRVKEFNVFLMAVSAVLVLGFCIGWLRIGITPWALGNRLMGWLVLLGYCSTGALLVARLGQRGLRRTVLTMACIACIVILVQTGIRALALGGWHFHSANLSINFQGYSGNRNTLAFQLLSVISLLVGYTTLFARPGKRASYLLLVAATGTLLFGLFLTGSRAGFGTGLVLACMALFLRITTWRFLLLSVATAMGIWTCTALTIQAGQLFFPSQEAVSGLFPIMTSLSLNSELIRWHSDSIAIKMFLEHPFMGAGLGVFFANSTKIFGIPVVIHSTPLWILAEFGLMGAAVFGWGAFVLVRHALRHVRGMPAEKSLVLLLLVFALFCQVHEILYQRIFWFLLGALLALPQHGAADGGFRLPLPRLLRRRPKPHATPATQDSPPAR